MVSMKEFNGQMMITHMRMPLPWYLCGSLGMLTGLTAADQAEIRFQLYHCIVCTVKSLDSRAQGLRVL